jgi:hypothetical protein
MCGGGLVLTQHQSCHRKWTINRTLAMGHQADPVHCYKFHILQQICSIQYYTILFWHWGRQQIAKIISQQYNKPLAIADWLISNTANCSCMWKMSCKNSRIIWSRSFPHSEYVMGETPVFILLHHCKTSKFTGINIPACIYWCGSIMYFFCENALFGKGVKYCLFKLYNKP